MSVIIRLANSADAEQVCEIYAPIVRDTHISFEQDIPDATEMAARIAKTMPRYPWLVCDIDGRIAGYAYASPFRLRNAYQWTVETTVYVREEYQRRGVSRALYTSLIEVLRAQGFCNAIGVIALPNRRQHPRARSRRLPQNRRIAEHGIQSGSLARHRLVAT